MTSRAARSFRWAALIVTAGAALVGCNDSTWSRPGSMISARAFHSATLLDNGSVLIAGGDDGGTAGRAELYDPVTGTWSPARSMKVARRHHTATLFLDGEGQGHVLVAGGDGGGGALLSAEIYHPREDTWSMAAPMKKARRGHTATLLRDLEGGCPAGGCRVLITGGDKDGAPGSAELYDPSKDEWTMAPPPMPGPRRNHTATLLVNDKGLKDGGVLIAGGDGEGGAQKGLWRFDPYAGIEERWSRAGMMEEAREGHTATLLHNGKVLFAGGCNGEAKPGGDCDGSVLGSAELYDPRPSPPEDPMEEPMEEPVAPKPMLEARAGHTATLLTNGMVLVAGGTGKDGPLSSAELYDPKSNEWMDAGSLADLRKGHSATRLPGGEVLIAGGDDGAALASADLYEPATQCRTLGDCPRSLVCNAQKQCVPPQAEPLQNGCAALDGQPPPGGAAWLTAVISMLAAAGRRRRRDKEGSR